MIKKDLLNMIDNILSVNMVEELSERKRSSRSSRPSPRTREPEMPSTEFNLGDTSEPITDMGGAKTYTVEIRYYGDALLSVYKELTNYMETKSNFHKIENAKFNTSTGQLSFKITINTNASNVDDAELYIIGDGFGGIMHQLSLSYETERGSDEFAKVLYGLKKLKFLKMNSIKIAE
jgi:hypothetical protein